MQGIHFIDDKWVEGEPLLLGPLTHATWMASVVFDGARAFEGVSPDLDRHCARLIASAYSFGLKPMYSAGQVEEIAREGIAKFGPGAAVYIRPMYWAENGAQFFVAPDPDSTRFCLSVFEEEMPEPGNMSICLSPLRRPAPDMAPTDAKASCLYPNSARALVDAAKRGFDNAVMLDCNNNVAELATANIWLGKDGAAHTPVANGTFLNGVTRQRVAGLFREAGVEVHERTITWADVMEADEVFTTGNLAKVMPITRVEGRDLQFGPLFRQARELYWEFAHKKG
ncbi:MAG: branched-chain amino acid aminotransferase [Proteobacteria bacterium]|nr:branched-chain amino acid aminotransferase [Pseudomonadota bacterium]